MHDFHQAGPICTLPQLNTTHLPEVEAWLAKAAPAGSITVILPCHADDLPRAALAHILRELEPAPWAHHVILSGNGFSAEAATAAERLLADLLPRACFLWNDGPAQQAKHAAQLGVAPTALPSGKGLNVWAAIGELPPGAPGTILIQDCDVRSFRRANLARLALPCVDPAFDYHFAKLYYARVTDRLYGRATRLFFTPLLAALQELHGPTPLLQYLAAFRYALAGECAISAPLAAQLPLAAGYGLELSMLLGVYQQVGAGTVCQVDGGSGYDHHHREAPRLAEMCGELTHLLVSACGTAADLPTHYRAAAKLAVQRSHAVALLNQLPHELATEQLLIDGFAQQVAAPRPPAMLPPWRAA